MSTRLHRLLLAATLLTPFLVQGQELSRIELPRQSEVIGTYDEQAQLLTCVTPHGRIIGHLAPDQITAMRPLSASEAADDMATMQKQVDEMIFEAKARDAARPPPAALAAATPASGVVQTGQPGAQAGVQATPPVPRMRRQRALRTWQASPYNPAPPAQGAVQQFAAPLQTPVAP